MYEALKESLAQAEAVNYLDFHPEGGEQAATLLGLKAEHLTGECQRKSLHQVCSVLPKFSSAGKGLFMAGKPKNMPLRSTFLGGGEGRGGEGLVE